MELSLSELQEMAMRQQQQIEAQQQMLIAKVRDTTRHFSLSFYIYVCFLKSEPFNRKDTTEYFFEHFYEHATFILAVGLLTLTIWKIRTPLSI